MHRLVRLVIFALLFASPAWAEDRAQLTQAVPTPFLGGSFRALVIGNEAYRDPKRVWPPLKTAVRDAEEVGSLLREQYRFGAVRLVRNASLREMVQAFNQLADEVQANDSVLIYYAGHGHLRQETGEGFWIPVDAEGDDDSTFLANAVVKTKVSVIAQRAKHVLVVSDSCFSGALVRGEGRGIRLERKTQGYFEKVAQKRSVHVLAAGGLEFVDDNYRNSGHSPFTYFFLNELRLSDQNLIEASDLALGVARNVANNVSQTPEHGILFGAGDEGGEFLFVRPPESAKAATVPPPVVPAEAPPAPQAAILAPVVPLVPAVVGSATTAGGPGLLQIGTGTLGAGLGLYAVYQLVEAVRLYEKSQDSAARAKQDNDRDLYDKSAEQEEDSQQAARTAALAAVGAGISFALAAWVFDGPPVATTERKSWWIAPVLVAEGEHANPGLWVMFRW